MTSDTFNILYVCKRDRFHTQLTFLPLRFLLNWTIVVAKLSLKRDRDCNFSDFPSVVVC